MTTLDSDSYNDIDIEAEAAKFHDMPVEEMQAVWDFIHASRRGDYKEAQRHLLKIRIVPEALLSAKKRHGADYVRKHYNTELADEKYGPGWLDE